MFLLVGLGNPGREYVNTRHNVGFEALNKFAFDHKIEFKQMKARAAVARAVFFGEDVLLVKPQTYMNLSGISVAELAHFYKILPEQIIVLYDDADIDLGAIRIRAHGSAGGHNGIRSIIEKIGTDAFIRIRIGVGPKPERFDLADFVLSQLSPRDHDDIIFGITSATDAALNIFKSGIDDTMNRFNKKQANKNDG